MAGIVIVVLTLASALAVGAVVVIFIYYKRKQENLKQGRSYGMSQISAPACVCDHHACIAFVWGIH